MASGAPNKPERLATFGGGSRDIELVPWDLAQTRHIDESMAFASMLAEQLHDRVPLAARSVRAAPLRILESANMTAVLIEMGFLSNADQAKELTGDGFQSSFAQALFDTIVKFRDSLATGAAK